MPQKSVPAWLSVSAVRSGGPDIRQRHAAQVNVEEVEHVVVRGGAEVVAQADPRLVGAAQAGGRAIRGLPSDRRPNAVAAGHGRYYNLLARTVKSRQVPVGFGLGAVVNTGEIGQPCNHMANYAKHSSGFLSRPPSPPPAPLSPRRGGRGGVRVAARERRMARPHERAIQSSIHPTIHGLTPSAVSSAAINRAFSAAEPMVTRIIVG